MIRIIAKLFAVAAVLTICLPIQPSSAESVAFVSATGGGTACTQTAPCASIESAIVALAGSGGRVVCLTAVVENAPVDFGTSTFVFDCPSAFWLGTLSITGSNAVLKFQHMGFSSVVHVTGGGTLIFDD